MLAHRTSRLHAAIGGLAIALPACNMFPSPGGAQGPKPPEFTPEGHQTKCQVMRSQLHPLIVEWSSADRAALEVLAQRGTVAVRYEGCEMEVLPRCKVPGSYSYAATTRKTEQVTIRNGDDLYASLPMGAAKLEATLASRGQLDVVMNVVGQYTADGTNVHRDNLKGDCAKATHVVTGLTVGAFQFTAGAETGASAEAGALGAGAGGRTSRLRETLSSDGKVEACVKATRGDTKPPEECGGLLRIELEPIAKATVAAPTQDGTAVGVGGLGAACPNGMKLVDGQCQPVLGLGGIVGMLGATRILVQVSCGVLGSTLGTDDGLQVWIDGEAVQPADEPRIFNPMSPGARGPVQHVAFDTTPGNHTVRVAALGCGERETTVQVESGQLRPVMGRLEPSDLFARPPAGAWSLGLVAQYGLVKFGTLKLSDYSAKYPVDSNMLTGFGGEMTIESQHVFFAMGFNHASGTGTFTVPDSTNCTSPSDPTCPVIGSTANVNVGFWQVPILLGARLPMQWVAATAGAGIQMSIVTSGGAEANKVFSTSSDLTGHVPLFLGLEARPFCALGIGARASRGLALGSDAGSFNMLQLSLAYHATMGCGSSDFGIQ